MQINFLNHAIKVCILILCLASCKTRTSDHDTVINHDDANHKVILPKEQVKNEGIKTVRIEKHAIAEVVQCNGSIESSPNAVAYVSAPIGGFIKKSFYMPGTHVNKGDILAILEHPDYLKLQQEYLEIKNQLDYYKEEFKRQGELTIENASSIKKMQQAQADFRTMEVKLLSLKAQLALIGINADSLSLEKFRTTINLRTPISGNISEVNAGVGKFAGPNDIIYQIIDNNNLLLHLAVPAKEITHVKKGQEIVFWPVYDKNKKYKASVQFQSRLVNSHNNTVSIYTPIHPHEIFLPGMKVDAEIKINTDTVFSVPIEAILNTKTARYMILKYDSLFVKIETITGKTDSEYVELINMPDSLAKENVVTQGKEFINSEISKFRK